MCVGIRGEDGKCVLARALRGFVEEGAADVRGQSSQLEAVSLVWHPVELEIRPPPTPLPLSLPPRLLSEESHVSLSSLAG